MLSTPAVLSFFLVAVLGFPGSVRSEEPKSSPSSPTPTPSSHGFVLQPDEGEALQTFNGTHTIKVSPRNGSGRLVLGTSRLAVGAGIGVHLHEHEDEILYVTAGQGTAIVGEERKPAQVGTTLYVPQGVWHGVENPEGEIELLWIVTPPGLEDAFRALGVHPGEEPKQLTAEEVNAISQKHGMRVKTE